MSSIFLILSCALIFNISFVNFFHVLKYITTMSYWGTAILIRASLSLAFSGFHWLWTVLVTDFFHAFSATIMEFCTKDNCFTFWAWGFYFSYNLHFVDRGKSSYQNVMIAWMVDVGLCQCLILQAARHQPFPPVSIPFPFAAGYGVPKACAGWSFACTAECNSNPFI